MALRGLLLARRFEPSGGGVPDLVAGFLMGAVQDAGLGLALGGAITLLTIFSQRLAKMVALLACVLVVVVGAVGTEYFAWSSHRLDAIFLAYIKDWRLLRGSVSAQVSYGFLALHAALALVGVVAILRGEVSAPADSKRALLSASFGVVLLVTAAELRPHRRTWFGSVAAGAPVMDLSKLSSTAARPVAPDEDIPQAIEALRRFSDPFETKSFAAGAASLVHKGGAAPAGTWGQWGGARPNLILLLLEGMEAGSLRAMGGQGLTPRLDALAEEGLLFRHFFSNGTHTPRALDAILCGVYPRLLGPTTSIVEPTFPLRCLPQILADHGYLTGFVHGGLIDFENRRTYLPHIGYQDLRFFEQFAPGGALANAGWGTTDAATYDEAINWLDARPRGQPFFLTVLSISNHYPFEVPDPSLALETDPTHRSNDTVRYADREVGKFIDALRARHLLDDSIVFILGDHGLDRTGAGAKAPATLGAQLLRRTHVPLLMVGSGVPHRIDDRLASQVDITPTVLDLLHLDLETHALGQSLGWTLSPERHDLPVLVHDVYSEVVATIEPGVIEVLPLDEQSRERAALDGLSETLSWKENGARLIADSSAADAKRARRLRQLAAAIDALYAQHRWWVQPARVDSP